MRSEQWIDRKRGVRVVFGRTHLRRASRGGERRKKQEGCGSPIPSTTGYSRYLALDWKATRDPPCLPQLIRLRGVQPLSCTGLEGNQGPTMSASADTARRMTRRS
ncbi:hypothetical protein B296_00020615 [Ensete ventricosum]|uniref:Uncharacterized protein n=1 Tax=Ensete ventricosum TaxID=4639 RepID=A0A427A2A0_ENSVE|nr:hypothetical protein B296_00020615 [Ensete ventricosum]